jgi:hypothetical protein
MLKSEIIKLIDAQDANKEKIKSVLLPALAFKIEGSPF